MIVIGYQGIGKSTIAGTNNCIDLESGNFWIPGRHTMLRDKNWYKPYCNIALHLHQQGYIVMISSHEVVRNYLKEIASEEDKNAIFVCFPDKSLQIPWTNKLWTRYEETQKVKDHKAWRNAEGRYQENIRELELCGFKKIVLDTMNYSLLDEIESAKKRI